MSVTTAPPPGVTFETISSEASFAAVGDSWDQLVRAMPRPSPLLLHGWLRAWWSYYGEGGELAVQVAYRDGALVGALPLIVRPRFGLRILTFIGGNDSALADVLLADGEGSSTAGQLAARVSSVDYDLADFFGLPANSRLAEAVGPERLRLIMRAEAPVLDLTTDWETIYQTRVSSKNRSHHRRRRRQLSELGRLETELARTRDELGPALEDAFRIHDLRWSGRPDGSTFGTQMGKEFNREALLALAELDVPRIVTLRLDGRAIAFVYYFMLTGRMYCYRLAFDPELGRLSPGLVNKFDALAAAAAEGATRIEFLGGDERYKMELADRQEPLYQALGLARTARGRAAVASRLGAIRLRRFAKRSPALRRFYYEGLAPARRLLGRREAA
jgi:CelD/BcsL family acetyltransferase involved in cellulose biosynthesis